MKENFKIVELEEILEPRGNGALLGQGWSPQCEKGPSLSEDDWGVLKTTAIQFGFFLENENKLLPLHLEPRQQHEVKPGDLLITCAGPRNRCGVACLVRKTRRRLLISGKMYRFNVNNEKALPEYIELYLLSKPAWDLIDKMKTGGSDSGLNLTHARFKKLQIPIPTIPEQKAIVSKIEELFSELDKGIENLKAAQAQLKTYRQAVLKCAFEGRLTNKDVKDGTLPEGWETSLLKDICEIRGGVTKGKDFKGRHTVSLPYLRVANVQDGYLDLDEIKYIDVLPTDREKYKLMHGDILYTEGGDKDKLGRGTIWKEQIDNCIHQNHIFRARPKHRSINAKYIAYFSQTRAAKNYFFKHGKQTTNLASINLTILSNLPVMVCAIEEQNEVVSQIELKLSEIDKMEESINQSLQQAEALRQSILKKAFEGLLI